MTAPPAPRYFAIFGSMRTGSNLLERTLHQYKSLIGLGELFNQHFIGKPKQTEAFGATLAERNLDPVGFLEKVIAAHPGQIPGFRIFDGHDARMLDHAARDPHCARIVLSRDPVDSFVSQRIAQETDQWMLRKEENRRLAKIRFDPEEFETYRARLEDHYARVRRAMRAAGRPAFEIAYDDLLDVDVLNGAARYAGANEEKTDVAEKIARQNPAALADKLTNPEAAAPYARTGHVSPASPRPRFRALDDLIVSRGVELVFAPAPGALDNAATKFIEGVETAVGAGDKALVQGLKQAQAERRRRRGAFVFSIVRHPATRLRDVFERLVLQSGASPFGDVREALVRDYGAPDAAICLTSRDAAGESFDAFMRFVEDSLANRAAAPLHPAWAPQATLLAAYGEVCPIDFIARAERIEADAAYVLQRLGVEDDGALASALRAEAEAPSLIEMTEAREAAARHVHALDFNRLGFGAIG
ncbi:MAG: sulfotransferase family 2 domain-containing protein [Pseudomonadota bacterium]